MSDFPSSKFERGKIFAKTGIDIGKNYAKHYLKKSMRSKEEGKESDDGEELSKLHGESAQKILEEFSKLRGTALKIAQSLSMDQGLLPEEYSKILTQAQYQVPPINKALVRSIIKRELGNYPEKIFGNFEAEAFAAASIGQVHRAWLEDGTPLAVKIQYPNVRDTIESDLRMAKMIFKRFIKGDIDDYFQEVQDRLMEETDYQHEGQQIDRFARRFNTEQFVTPRWYQSYSTGKVLTMSYLEGKHINEFLEQDPPQEKKNLFGQLMWDFFHAQIKQSDPIHADAHPGNFLFMPDERLGIIDFGCVKSFPRDFYYNYLKLLPTHLHHDPEDVKKLYLKLGIIRKDPGDSEKEQQFYEFCRNYADAFASPYQHDQFDFGDPDFKKRINQYARQMPILRETRGSRHFIYSTRVHLGLYHLLMKLEATVNTKESRRLAQQEIESMRDEFENG